MTKKFLASQGVSNAQLFHRDELKNIPDGSIDLIYSFIVFQHFDSMEEVDFYLRHIARLLSPQGVAHIYFGKNKNEGVAVTSDSDFLLRDCSLFINPKVMSERVSKDFQIIAYNDLLPRDPVTNTGESVQAMILFRN
jgi:ubiquinone/menaquinone biosynthesis C-methylase UbiE